MMQEMQTIVAKNDGQEKKISNEGFAVLLALARRPLTADELRASVGMSSSEVERTLNRFRLAGMVVDSASVVFPSSARSISLTSQGELALFREMEKMCELPER